MYSAPSTDSKINTAEGRPNPIIPASGIPSPCISGVQFPTAAGRTGNWTTRLCHCFDDPANCE